MKFFLISSAWIIFNYYYTIINLTHMKKKKSFINTVIALIKCIGEIFPKSLYSFRFSQAFETLMLIKIYFISYFSVFIPWFNSLWVLYVGFFFVGIISWSFRELTLQESYLIFCAQYSKKKEREFVGDILLNNVVGVLDAVALFWTVNLV